jgi:hypothetical protein
MAWRLMLVIFFFVASAANAGAQGETTILRPEAIDEVLVNPGMGIETFQRVNGDAINSAQSWSEEGPVARLTTAAGADFPASSISYCRWFWETFEPEQGKVRWEIIDTALREARAHHQALAIRLMPYDQRHPLPEWYRKSGARRANKPTDKDGDIWQPDFADPRFRCS